VVRLVADDRKQQAVREQMKRSAQLTNQKFYCSDGNCPYSEGKFVGYGSRPECLGHIRSYHKQEPVENAHIDVTGIAKGMIPQLLSKLVYRTSSLSGFRAEFRSPSQLHVVRTKARLECRGNATLPVGEGHV